MTPTQDTILFGLWTGIMAGFNFLWVTMLLAWWSRRDSRALLYVLLLSHLSAISGINAVIRGMVLPISPYTLVSVQRGLWVTILFVLAAMVDIYFAEHNGRPPLMTRLWHWMTATRRNTHRDREVASNV